MNDYKKKERRKYERYGTEAKVYFRVVYEIETKVEYQVLEKVDGKKLSEKHPAMSKNISAEGLCFTSSEKLKKGDFLYLEVYLPSQKEPIHMEGQVRWSHMTSQEEEKENKFDVGVKLITVNGKSVLASIHFDEANKVIWSSVLESVFGEFRKLAQKKAHSQTNKERQK